MSSLLPPITDRNRYREFFKQNHHWDRAIACLVERHQLSGAAQRSVLGSHIVYRVGDCWIKLMAPIYANDMAYELRGLHAVSGKLSVKSPQILGEGSLEGWPYVILSHIGGQPIRAAWSGLEFRAKLKIADQIAVITQEISRCTPNEVVANRFIWNQFIQQQYDSRLPR